MDDNIRLAARAYLDLLRDVAKADILTCHIKNPYSKLFWLFHKSAKTGYYFDEVAHGPLTHLDQNKKLLGGDEGEDYAPKRQGSEEFTAKVKIYSQIPASFKERIMAGRSFVERESIRSAIRIIIEPKGGSNGQEQGSAHIFVNYREQITAAALRETVEDIFLRDEFFKKILVNLIDRPRISDHTAWKYRSHLLGFWHTLSQHTFGRPSSLSQKPKIFYQALTKTALELVKPGNGNACFLSLLRGSGTLEPVGYSGDMPEPTLKQKRRAQTDHGIVHYVANSGQTFLVNNIPAYQKKLRTSGLEKPAYCNFGLLLKGKKSELAVPLIVQGHVVGVLNFESNEFDAFNDESVLLAAQLATFTAFAVRQVRFGDELRNILDHQAQLHTKHEDRDEHIFKSTAASTENILGWLKCYIWDNHTGCWYDSKGKDPAKKRPRIDDGFARWISAHKLPIAIVNLKQRKSKEPDEDDFECYIAKPTGNGDAIHWNRLSAKERKNLGVPLKASESLQNHFPKSVANKDPLLTPVITNIGFPIFNDKGDVRAELWVTCMQHFVDIPDDEAWCMWVVCQTVTQCLDSAKDALSKLPEKYRAFYCYLLSELQSAGSEGKSANSIRNDCAEKMGAGRLPNILEKMTLPTWHFFENRLKELKSVQLAYSTGKLKGTKWHMADAPQATDLLSRYNPEHQSSISRKD